MEDTRKTLCDRCRSFVPMSDIKYSIKGDKKIAICSKCRNKVTAPGKSASAAPKSNKIAFVCRRCNYKFKHDPSGVTNLKCPYCGREDKVEEDLPQPADRLIMESEGVYR